MQNLATRFPPMTASGWDYRLNLDGHVNYARSTEATECWSYTQLFRNGIVECVLSNIESNNEENGKLYSQHSTNIELRIIINRSM